MPDDKQDLSFPEFHKAVNDGTASYGAQKVREAVASLQLTSYTYPGDRRRSFYSRDWVKIVRDYLDRPNRP